MKMEITTKQIIAASAIGAALLFCAFTVFNVPIFHIPIEIIKMVMKIMGLKQIDYFIPGSRWYSFRITLFVSAAMWGFVFSVMAMRIISQKDRFGGLSVEYFLFVVWQVINFIAAIATVIVVLFGIACAESEHNNLWYVAGVGVFITAIVAIFRNLNCSLLYLFLACIFSFSSCVANFRWRGG